MATIKDLEPRLRKLIPMLGSDNSGEVANAARMITTIMKASKLDWHDVVKTIFENNSSSGNGYYDYNYQSYSNKYEQYKKSYEKKSQEKTSQEKTSQEDAEIYWEEKPNGNHTGTVFGLNCTIFKSKKNNGLWDAVVNEFGGNTKYLNGFKTVEEAKKKIKFLYDPNEKDDW